MKKKVCIVRSGDVTYISRIHRTALALQESNNYDVTILSIIPRDNLKRRDYSYEMNYVEIRFRAFKSSIFSAFRIFEGLTKLFFKSLRLKANIYIAIGIEDLIIVYLVSKLTGAKFVYSANELEGDRKRIGNKKLNKKLNKAIIKLEKKILKKAEGVFAADIERAKIMEEWYDLDKVHVIRNVPILEDFSSKNLIREKLNISQNQKILLYQGIINYGRGIETAIKACAKAQSNNFCLVLLGFISESYKERLLNLASETNFQQLYVLPPVPWRELLYWTKSADISMVLIENVSISYYLAAPNKIYESIMVGVPYIASDFPEMNHVHKIAKSGILVNPEDVSAVSKAIDTLIEDESFYQNCVKNSLLGKAIFNWNEEKKKLINFIDKISLV